ncbi:DEAD/DEAH box helicase [Halomonadaceae bacterium KBTZ08]
MKNSASKRQNSAKLDYLMEMLPALLEEGRRILIFSQFTSMLELIQAELRSRHLDYALLTGDTRDRDTPISRFQNGEVPIFLISLRAGGVGLNLTAADCVIHYDPWWNPAVEDQATDRAWRIGQDKPVMVYRLVCEGTVEERMEAIKADKAALAESVYGEGGSFSSSLTAEDVQVLFQPIGA